MRDLLLAPAGVVVGIINAFAGGGSLVSFPLFLAIGYSPFVANISNSVGVFTSNVGAIVGYRRDLRSLRSSILRLGSCCAAGTVVGVVILLVTGEAVFTAIAPWLIGIAALLVLFQPMIVRRLRPPDPTTAHPRSALVGIFFIGIYGGYFGPGAGIMFLGALGMFIPETMQRINALKNVCMFINNAICVVIFSLFADVAWTAAIAMGVGCIIGGFIGAHIARKLSDRLFRAAVVIVGFAAAIAVALY